MMLNNDFIINTLTEEKLWKVGESDSFSFGNWNLTLEKVSNTGFKYYLYGNRSGINERKGWRYENMESAFLDVLNGFKRDVQPDYENINDALENAYKWEIDVTKGVRIVYQNITASGNLTEQRIYRCKDKADFQRVIDLANDGKVKILEIDGETAEYLK